MKVHGSRVNLSDVEELLTSEGYECVCGGVDNHLKIYISKIKNEAEIRSYVARLMNMNQAAITVVSVDHIPRNDYGKVLYSELS